MVLPFDDESHPSCETEASRGLQRLARTSLPGARRLPIARVREVLGLPEPPCAALLAEDRWLAGGAVLRWLSGRPHRCPESDYDLFVPSTRVFHALGRDLLTRGFVFRCFRSRDPMCQLCGGLGRIDPRGTVEDGFLPLFRIECEICGAFGGADASTLTADLLLPISRRLIARRGIFALELASPQGELVHVSAIGIQPTVERVIERFDFSVVQLAIDHETLYYGHDTLDDLCASRLRLGYEETFEQTVARMRKYAARGFQPDLRTVLWVLLGHLRFRLRRSFR